MKRSDLKRNTGIVLIVLGILLAFAVMLLLISDWEKKREAAKLTDPNSPEYRHGAKLIDNKWYVPKQDLITVLGIGVDKFEADIPYEGNRNNQQADFLMLLILNRKTESFTTLHINRDTVTEIQRLGLFGDLVDSFPGQIALSHTFGSGGKDSCRNTVRAVSGLLYGARIDHYVSFTMDAVPEAADLVGGVQLELLDDFTMHDPEMKKGALYMLEGEKALIYVRGRRELETTTNINRMKRQRQFLTALKGRMTDCYTGDADFLVNSIEILSKYMITDCTANQLSDYCDKCLNWRDNGIIEIEGEAKRGREFTEFYADEAALKKLTLSLLYEPYSN